MENISCKNGKRRSMSEKYSSSLEPKAVILSRAADV
jgi:hypothetical protein